MSFDALSFFVECSTGCVPKIVEAFLNYDIATDKDLRISIKC